jgi:predicted TPR repeat methyltransferase
VRAVEALEHAVRIRAWEAEPWAAMGEIHHRMGVKSKAEACFQRVLELDPSFPIPQDVNLEAFQKAAFPAKPGKKGLFGGRGRKT